MRESETPSLVSSRDPIASPRRGEDEASAAASAGRTPRPLPLPSPFFLRRREWLGAV